MATTILIKTGLSASIPDATFQNKEIFFASNTNKLYVRNGANNIMINPWAGITELWNDLSVHVGFTTEIAKYVKKAGDTMTGYLTLNAAPTLDLHSATKKYVDDQISNVVLVASGAMRYIGAWDGTKTIQVNITDNKTAGNFILINNKLELLKGDVFTVTVAGSASGLTTPNGDTLKVGDTIVYKDATVDITASVPANILASSFVVGDNTTGTLNTNNTTTQSVNSSETFGGGEIKLHKVAKTGTYSDLIGTPTAFTGTLITSSTSQQKIATATTLNAAITLHDVARTGIYTDLLNKPTYTHTLTGDASSPKLTFGDGTAFTNISLVGGNGITFGINGQQLTINAPTNTAEDGTLQIYVNNVEINSNNGTFSANTSLNHKIYLPAPDWNQSSSSAADFIKNKPTIPALASTAPTIVKKQTATQGTGTTSARADHKHDLQVASTSEVGGVKVDGTYIKIVSDVIVVDIIDGGTF